MVAELTGIPVSAGAANRSSRAKTLKSKIIGNFVGRNACYTGSASTSSLSSDRSENREEKISAESKNSTRPRWIRNATREPIHSFLNDRDNSGCKLIRENLVSRSCVNEHPFENQTSAVKDRETRYDNDPLPIYQESCEEASVCPANNRQRVASPEFFVEEESENDEYALYSVVRKPPKLVFPGTEVSKLPIVREEASSEEQREEVLKKQRELHKWLESAEPIEAHCDSEKIGKRERSVNREMEDSPIERIDGKREEIVSGGEKIASSWSKPGVSIPRGVVGMVGPFCRVYRNPNEQREYMLQEEFQERAIDVGDEDRVNGVPESKRVSNRSYENEEIEDEESSAIGTDSPSEAGTFVDRNNDREIIAIPKKSVTSIADDESLVVEEQQHRPRAKWRFVEEFNDTESQMIAKEINKKIDNVTDKSQLNRAWSTDQIYSQNLNTKENYDLDVPPKYTSRKSEGKLSFFFGSENFIANQLMVSKNMKRIVTLFRH